MRLDWKDDGEDRSDFAECVDLPDGRRASITEDIRGVVHAEVGVPDPDDASLVCDISTGFCVSVDSTTVGSGNVYRILKEMVERMLDVEEV